MAGPPRIGNLFLWNMNTHFQSYQWINRIQSLIFHDEVKHCFSIDWLYKSSNFRTRNGRFDGSYVHTSSNYRHPI